MAFELKFQVDGWDNLIRSLWDFENDVWDLKEEFSAALDIIQDWVDQNFKREQSDTEWRWTNLTEPVLKARARRRWNYRAAPNNPWILRWTGRLQESVTKTAEDMRWVIEYTAPYARYHNIWWKKIPKRKFLELSPETKHKIDSLFYTSIYHKLEKLKRK